MLIGRLGRDPEVRDGKRAGSRWGSFSLATHRRRKVGEDWEETTDWHRVKVFGSQADQCERFLGKGSLVAVEGSLHAEPWTDAEGKKRTFTSVVADSVSFLDSTRRNPESSAEEED
jgi:single-strand DNA-binding protein